MGAVAQALLRIATPASASFVVDSLVPLALAFVAIGSLARTADAAFKAQAEKIAELERQLSNVQH
jgi:hypothetical protein